MKIHFIVNPNSGRRGASACPPPMLRKFIAERGLDAEVSVTREPGHATELARRAVELGCARVVAVGGDGTMNEIAQSLVGTPVALALIRCGSGNGLARYLGVPASPVSALALAANPDSPVASIDTGKVNDRRFFNAMGLGFDAEVTRRFSRNPKRGFSAYAGAVVGEFLRRRSERCEIVSGETREVMEALFIAVANSDQYGNAAVIAPGARVDDGLLNLVAVPPVGTLMAADLAVRMFTGTLNRSPRVRQMLGTHFTISRPGPGLIHTDGDIHEEGAILEISIAPSSLRVVVPPVSRRPRGAR